MAYPNDKPSSTPDIDIAIIGAGISGINTAYRIQTHSPLTTYKIYESRASIGGTWSLFKYPGLRSDSDLFSFGFEWNPWKSDKVIAQADDIMAYLKSSLRSFGGDNKVDYGMKLSSLDWSTEDQLWTLVFTRTSGLSTSDPEKPTTTTTTTERVTQRARWVVLGTGYYDYENALPANIPGLDSFKGPIIHPQFWPDDLDLTNKRVAIIGSGATAITILPSIAPLTSNVTIIQRSPTYIAKVPSVDPSADTLKRWLPSSWAHRLLRLKYLWMSYLFFTFCQSFPNVARKMLAKATSAQLPRNIPLDPHFTPAYGPWDQRLCASPDGDFYTCLREGKANIITGHIERINHDSIVIQDQPESTLRPDIIITATGLKILVGGGARISVDGVPVDITDKMMWRQCMIQDVPNLITIIGYTNASWTLGADVALKTLTRVMDALQRSGRSSATPCLAPGSQVQRVPFMKMKSTYLLRGNGEMPYAGDRGPWVRRGSYFGDLWGATYGDVMEDLVSVGGAEDTVLASREMSDGMLMTWFGGAGLTVFRRLKRWWHGRVSYESSTRLRLIIVSVSNPTE
jgi:cation diffusion facilitator CzcD-associated flavoprotein CzcO